MKVAFRDEAFRNQPGVAEAVKAIASSTAMRYRRHIRGSCEMAMLLLFVMSGEGEGNLADAEADAFWCLSSLLLSMNDTIAHNENQAKQAQHIQWLLRVYDPELAELLRGAGIV